MSLRLIISSIVILINLSSHAANINTEKIDRQPPSLLNPDIPRLAIPATPHHISLPAFGQGIIGWGTGPDGAEKRLHNITKADVDKLKTQHVDLDMIQSWQQFYENETQRNPNNPTAPLRAKLMHKISQLW
ncbi:MULTISPECIES: DUF4951 domain-containing protein [unclassified Acinetobacter]|uniref:DUF4951 domain-containing protein n=1 Tax=unclassified Acinetobacter TaxID=196816 RepID=UPI002934548A|nr:MULTISPECIES: DUF4951 domain-containing protein [unclassified Acinetobacter]WOE33128.1 DUF4951 domain-containing protein [Acinetobacter sp. SAAs470]WOE39794.1 DUF4951 domain-containing protein [Acinetobacter sp. SAAs474]